MIAVKQMKIFYCFDGFMPEVRIIVIVKKILLAVNQQPDAETGYIFNAG